VNGLNLCSFGDILHLKGAIDLPKNKMLDGFMKRFQEILDALDEMSDSDEMDELNAQFEDILFLMESVDPEEEDAQEELEGALEEMEDLLEEYRELEMSEIDQKITELEMALRMARNNL